MRRALTALLIATLSISLSGCGAGLNAETRNLKQVTDGVEATVNTEGNNIKVVNLPRFGIQKILLFNKRSS